MWIFVGRTLLSYKMSPSRQFEDKAGRPKTRISESNVVPILVADGMCARAFGLLGKSIVLPEAEMDRGPEHDDKAEDWDS